MPDENGNQLLEKLQTACGTPSRPLKRFKNTFNILKSSTTVVSDSLSAFSEELNLLDPIYVPICLRRTNFGPYGDFHLLPTELTFKILDYIPLRSIGYLGQTSKALRDVIIEWVISKRFNDGLVNRILHSKASASSAGWSGQSAFPLELRNEGQGVGVLIKRLTCVFPTMKRLEMYHQLIHTMKNEILVRDSTLEQLVAINMSGVILQSLVAGWDKKECITVFETLMQWNCVTPLMNEYEKKMTDEVVERTLRFHLRALFLDHCSKADLSMWINIVFSQSRHSNSPEWFAKLLLLLYAPVEYHGGIRWTFSSDDELDFSFFVDEYRQLADAMTRLTSTIHTSTEAALELFDWVTSEPREWSKRAVACLLLCLHCVNSRFVTSYFSCIAEDHQADMAAQLLSEVIYVSAEFIASQPQNTALLNARSVLTLIRNAMKCGWSTADQREILREIWNEVGEVALRLFDDSVAVGNSDDLDSFLGTWKDICIQLLY